MQITTRCSFIVNPTKQMGCSNFKCKIYLEELQPELLSDWSVWLEVLEVRALGGRRGGKNRKRLQDGKQWRWVGPAKRAV